MGAAFAMPLTAGAAAIDFPGIEVHEPETSRRALLTGGLSALLHGGVLGLLFLLAYLAPALDEELIPVQLLKEETPKEAAPAPRVLAERRLPNFAPQVQAVAPQIVNPRVIADSSPAVTAEALQMDSVSSVVAPTQIARSNTVVERVSAVNSPIAARATAVDVSGIGGPVVRGPVKIDAPVGPSVGPTQVQVASTGSSMGTGKLSIGSGSSVREGVISNRDVIGSPTGAPLVNIDTAIGEGYLRGSGGTGSSVLGSSGKARDCLDKPVVVSYLGNVESRTLDRWILPPGVAADQKVTLRFALDVAGSPITVSLVRASDNALGASAIDALRAAAPFPPMPEEARCLVRLPITATFSNPGAS